MSKGLEALERVKKAHYVASIVMQLPHEDTETIEAINIIEKELKEKAELQELLNHERELNNHLILHECKALGIIKETFKITFDDEELTIGIDSVYFLTFKDKAKYDLLKEVLL